MNNPNYIFNLPTSQVFKNYVEYREFFSPPECREIIKLGSVGNPIQGTVTDQSIIDLNIRKSQITWIECLHENAWIWHKLGNIANESNDNIFGFKLLGFKECLQFAEYTDSGDHYGWHMDFGIGLGSVRKLSMTVQLSEPDAYTGGDLELWFGSQPIATSRSQGTVIIFPSFTMHRVTPVTNGLRHSAVIWVSGPEPYR